MFKFKIHPDTTMALLNLKPVYLTHIQFKLLIQQLTAARQTIAKAWKSPLLGVVETKNRMNNFMIHSKMAAIENNLIPKFEKIWNPWIKFFTASSMDEKVLLPW